MIKCLVLLMVIFVGVYAGYLSVNGCLGEIISSMVAFMLADKVGEVFNFIDLKKKAKNGEW